MKKLSFICGVLLSLSLIHGGKFDGVSLGASIGGNMASLKETSITDGFKQLGANGKIYAGIGKSFLDILFIGTEVFGRYSFFVKPEDVQKESMEGSSQFGGYLKVGVRPTENLLIYGLYGVQTSSAKIRNALEKFFEPSDGSWSNIIGGGMEYAFGLGTAVRLEGLYEPETKFTLKDITNIEYKANFFSLNLGIVIYL